MRPEMATLNVGTINFGEDVFMNKAADTAEMARRIARARRDARGRDLRRGPPRHRGRAVEAGARRGAAASAVRARRQRRAVGERAQPRISRRAHGGALARGLHAGASPASAAISCRWPSWRRCGAATRASASRTTSRSTRACSPKDRRRWWRARSSCASATVARVATVDEARAMLGRRAQQTALDTHSARAQNMFTSTAGATDDQARANREGRRARPGFPPT